MRAKIECHAPRIVYLWSLDMTPLEKTTAEKLEADQLSTCGSIVHLVQALAKHVGQRAPVVGQPRRATRARATRSARRYAVSDLGIGSGHRS